MDNSTREIHLQLDYLCAHIPSLRLNGRNTIVRKCEFAEPFDTKQAAFFYDGQHVEIEL